MKLDFFRKIFEKILKYQFPRKSFQWERSCSTWMDGRTDNQTERHYKANSRFSQVCEWA